MISRTDIDDMSEGEHVARQATALDDRTVTRAAQIAEETQIPMTYRNWRGEVAQRIIRPVALWFGRTDWHPEPGWLLNAWDCDKGERRDFALVDCQFADLTRPSQALDAGVDPRNAEQMAAYIEGGHLFSEGECRAAAALIRDQAAEIARLRTRPSQAGDRQRVQEMHDANWRPAVTYWRERAEKAEAASQAGNESVARLVKAARDAEFDLSEWLECRGELIKAGFNMDGTEGIRDRLRPALAAMDTPKGGGDE